MVRLRYLESVENLLGFVWESNVPSTVGRPLVDSIIKFVNKRPKIANFFEIKHEHKKFSEKESFKNIKS